MCNTLFDQLYAQIEMRELKARRRAQEHSVRGRPTMATYNDGMADALQHILELMEELNETQHLRG